MSKPSKQDVRAGAAPVSAQQKLSAAVASATAVAADKPSTHITSSPFCFTPSTSLPNPAASRVPQTMSVQKDSDNSGLTGLTAKQRLTPQIPEHIQNVVESVSSSRLDRWADGQQVDLEDEDEDDDFDGSTIASIKPENYKQRQFDPTHSHNNELFGADDPLLALQELPLADMPLAKDVEAACLHLIRTLKIPSTTAEQAKQITITAGRMARVYLSMLSGVYKADPFTETIAHNTNTGLNSQTLGPIEVQTICRQHLLPLYGSCTIVIVKPKVIKGTTKYRKYLRWLCSRPWLQEELGTEIATRFCLLSGASKVEVTLSLEQVSLEPTGLLASDKVLTRHSARSKSNGSGSVGIED